MIRTRRARIGLTVAVMLCASAARAGVWGVDPTVGVTADYASNPVLLNLPSTSATDAALLVDSPISYQGDALTLSFVPSFRLNDRRSYASLNSDYVHLNLSGEFDAERNTVKMTLGANRDSSLYQNFLVNGEAAVRRDGLSADLTYTRHLTERLDADLDVNTLHVVYGTASGSASLVSYRNSTAAPDLAWQLSERDRATLSVSVGQYDALDGSTRSRDGQAQLAYHRLLTEIWSLDLGAGYTRQQNRLSFVVPQIEFIPGYGFVIVDFPVTVETQVDSPVYSAKLNRSGPRLTLNLSASRQETPIGFAFLSRQTIYDLQLSYALSARWSVSLHESWLNAHNPGLQGSYLDQTVNSVSLDSSYQLTENFSLDLALSRIDLTYNAMDLHLVNNQVTLKLSYKFDHIGFQ